jgi:hypothetical protein
MSSTYIKIKEFFYKNEQDPYCKGEKQTDKWVVQRGHGCNGKRGNIPEEG